jgi:Winged helix-turn-helix DNA-binding
MDWGFVGAIAAALIGVAGILLSQLIYRQERQRESEQAASERQQSRREEFLFRALDHFGGKTQERSVGIAIAEAYWRQVPELVKWSVHELAERLNLSPQAANNRVRVLARSGALQRERVSQPRGGREFRYRIPVAA